MTGGRANNNGQATHANGRTEDTADSRPNWVPEGCGPVEWAGTAILLESQGWALRIDGDESEPVLISGTLPEEMNGRRITLIGYWTHTTEGPRFKLERSERYVYQPSRRNPTKSASLIIPQRTCSKTSSLTAADGAHIARISLDEIALDCGTDKSAHGYTLIYERYTHTIRDKVANIMEFGVADGASTLMWSKWFYNAYIHGFDLNLIEPLGERITHYQLDCTSDKIADVARHTQPDIIVDDAAHTMLSHQQSFDLTFPHLKHGGLYIIEDLETCYAPDFGGSPTHYGEPFVDSSVKKHQSPRGRTVDWLSELSHAVNFRFYSKEQQESSVVDIPCFNEIESVHLYCGIAIIEKRRV
jgi:hypothetical protein